MPHMYILDCADGSYCTGSTWDLDRRLSEHQSGLGANFSAKRLPVKLVSCEYYDRVDDAFYREKQVQGWSRRKKQALIEGDKTKRNSWSTLATIPSTHRWLRQAQPPAATLFRCLSLSKAAE